MNLSKDKTRILLINYYNYRAEENEDTDQRIISYLKSKVKKIFHIAHPFPEFGSRYSYLTLYEDGKKIKQFKFYILRGPSWIQYLYHIIITYFCVFKSGFVYDLCIAAANLSFISIFPLRLFFIKRLVYYSVDFVPNRFPNSFLNSLYHFMDAFACRYSDNNWMMTEEQIAGRKQFGITSTNSAPFTIVPIGYDTKKIHIPSEDKIKLEDMVYMGAMRESTGPELAIKTIPLLIKRYPKINLTMIGAGKDTNKLKKLIKKLRLGKHVNFLGYIANFWDMVGVISQKSIGLAPYKPIPDSFSFYSDPSKIKLYMCCGLTVITTDVATMSNLILNTQSGLITDYSEKSLFNTITYLLEDKTRFYSFRKNAIKLSKQFDINHILDNAINKIPY